MNPKQFSLPIVLCLLIGLGLEMAHAAVSFVPDDQPIAYVGKVAVSGNDVSTGSEHAYALDYSSQDWSGNLHSYSISTIGIIDTIDAWDGGAAGQVDLQNMLPTSWNPAGRYIVTKNGSSGVPFMWPSLSSAQKGLLDSGTAVSATSSPVLNYIRGDRSNEAPSGNDYRARSTVLGDIIHSTPVYCDAATCGAETVFVGANDGMLHAINASTTSGGGSERFAYIPSMLIGKLPALKVDPYGHKYFVDGNLDIRKFGSTTILAGTLGAGGRGVFALNVTAAAATSEADAASKILWEATNTGAYANLGYTYSQPRLVNVKVSGIATPALIVGNGYNNVGNYHSSLFVINASTGVVLQEIDAGSGTSASPNGLSSPTVIDDDGDGNYDIAYAGDLNGNVWKFDLVANSSVLLYNQSQAITMAPGVMEHPLGGHMVTFVTGRIFTGGTGSDITDGTTHAAYGIWDRPGLYSDNDTLLTQTLTETTYSAVTPEIRVRTATANVPDWSPGAGHHKGWKTELITSPPSIGGERVVGDGAFISDSIFVFTSTNPTVSPTATPPGESWVMHLNALTGGNTDIIRFDLNGDHVNNTADQLSDGERPVGRRLTGGGLHSQRTGLVIPGSTVYVGFEDTNGTPADADLGVAGGHLDMEIYYNFSSKCPLTGSAGSKTSGTVTFSGSGSKTGTATLTITPGAGGTAESISYSFTSKTTSQVASGLKNLTSASYKVTAASGSMITIQSLTSGAQFNGTVSVTITGGFTSNAPRSLTGGSDASGQTSSCDEVQHIHEYDDTYNVTGLNMLDADHTAYDLANAIPSTATEFKVIAQNQYLSPAAEIHIGNPDYLYNVDAGYIQIKNFTTSATLDVATLPTYTRIGSLAIGSLAINVPVDAFTPKNWWGGALGLPADVRVGVHPTQAKCVRTSDGSQDGNMFQPVNPPLSVTLDGNGTLGYNSGTTSLTATGVRHNGALGIEIIRADTPNSALELSIPGHPEYGWRVKASKYNTYVLAEYTTFWHDKVNPDRCYGTADWTKLAASDTRECDTSKPPKDTATTKVCAKLIPASGTDPRIGTFASGGGGYDGSHGAVTSEVKTTSPDGSVTTVTTYSDGTIITTTTTTGVKIDPPEFSSSLPVGRVNWRELLQ
ncbi:MAG: PilC/PilY family type IV pilus protein [Thiobacillaceae bacterium]